MGEPLTKDLFQEEKDKEIHQKKFELKTLELIELQVGQPMKSPSLPKVIRMEEGPGVNTIEIKVGKSQPKIIRMEDSPGGHTIELKVGQGMPKVVKLQEGPGVNAIELSVGPNKIRIDDKGVTIEGLKVQVKGQIQLQLQAPILQINGDGMVKVQGGVIMLN